MQPHRPLILWFLAALSSWSHYKIDKKKEKIGVFVSIVSTKIPFKGTGKEFIGNDIPAISSAVKRALQACCLQLKSFVAKRDAERDRASRQALMYRVRRIVASTPAFIVGTVSPVATCVCSTSLMHLPPS